MAKYLSRRETRVGDNMSLFWSGLILMIPVALIFLQPDVGSMLVYAAFVFVLYREGHVPVGVLLFALFIIILFCILVVY